MTAILLVMAVAIAAEPSYLVERVVTCGGEVRRVSVFRNGTLVVATSRAGQPPHLRRRPLDEVERQVLQQLVEESYTALAEGKYRVDKAPGDTVEVRLAPPGREPMRLVAALALVRPLPLCRVEHALDELELTMAEGPAEREDLSSWVPVVGERLELLDGRLVTVTEVFAGEEDLVVYLRIGDGPAAEYFFLRELRAKVGRRVGR